MAALAAVLALVAGLQVVTATVAPVPDAQAATVNLGTVQAQMADHLGKDNGTNGNCIRYSPSSGSPSVSPSAWVTNPAAAITAHGYSGSCPTNLDVNTQSAVAFVPSSVSSVDDGTPFLIGRMTHYNNPVTTNDEYYSGKLNTRLSGFGNATITFNWNLDETPNTGGNCCDDTIEFTNQVADLTLTQGGLTFKLVMLGFVKSTTQTCPAQPDGTIQNLFKTVERAQTNACLYAQLSQVRQLKIVKTVVGSPPGTPTFPFTTTSALDGTPWSNRAFTIGNGQSIQDTLTSGNTVTITETNPSDDRWALTGLTCQQWNANGTALVDVPRATLNLAARQAILSNVPAPLYVNDPLITCTFTNTYTPRTTLTLVKQVQGGVVSPTLWTLTATGNAAPTAGVVISGVSGSAGVTNQRIVAGSYQLTERGSGGAETGFVQVDNWACAAGGTNYPVSATGVVTLPDLAAGTTVTCTVINRQAVGSLRISKVIDDPNGGYIGGASKTFSGRYDCGTGYTGSFTTLSTGSPYTVGSIPAGRSCTVTETAPTGGLLNASFAWGAPTYSTQPVIIADQAAASVTITNHVVQRFGTFAVTKVISGPGGYTGGTTRVFPVTYNCLLTNGPTTSGTLNLTAAQAVSPSGSIPMGSVCTLGETLTQQPGDFGDPSYAWVQPPTVAPASVTIGDNTTAAVTITNTYTRETGQLVIAKVVQGAGYIGTGEPFVVRYNCGVASGTVTLAPGGSKTVTVPARNPCAVQEESPGSDLLDSGHVWGTPTWSPAAAATVPANGSVTLTVTNPTVPVFGRVQVTKAISGETDGVTGAARFDITVDCDNGESDTFTVPVAGSGVTPDLPVGTTCTISETPPTGGLADSSYAWSPDVQIAPTDQVTITEPNQLITVTVTNTVVRVRGSLAITKALVDPDGVVAAGRQFSMGYRCVHGSDAPVEGTVQIGAGETAMIDGLLLGSSCTVIEDPASLADPPSATDSSYVWLPVSYLPGNAVTVAAESDPAQVTVTNRVDRLLSTFQLSKAVIGAGADGGYDTDVPFTFTVNCSNGLNTTVTLKDGESWTPAQAVPVDTQCAITESAARPDTDPAFGWDPVEWSVDRVRANGSSVTFTITEANVPVQVNAINPITPRFGSVQLTKQVTGETSGLIPGASFAMTLNCGPGQLFRIPLANGGSFTQGGIRAGSSCTAVEAPPSQDQLVDASFAWGTPTYDPGNATVTIAVDTSRTIAVTNPIVRVSAPVRLVKTLSGPQGVVPANRTYPVTWSCTYGGNQIAGDTLDLTADPAGVVLPDEVPLTAECTASEGTLAPPSADPAFRWLDPQITGVTVTAAGPNTITVANSFTRDEGTVTVHKEVTGATGGYVNLGDPTKQDFTMHGQCLVPGHPEIPTRYADGDIADGGSVVIDPVSVGWTCSGYEDTPSQGLLRDTSYAWGTPIITGRPALTPPVGGTFTLPGDGANQDFFVANPIVRVGSTFKITKSVVDPFGVVPEESTFTGTYSCSYGSDSPVTGAWSLTNGETFTGPSVYLNSVCTVTEDPLGTTGLPDASYAWGSPTIGGPVTVVPGGTATVAVTNTVNRLYGGLQVTKTLVDPDGGAPAGLQFGGVWTCTIGDQTYSDRFTVAAGAPAVLFTPANERVPATAVCSIIEDTPDPTVLFDQSFGWAPPTYDPADVTLASGETASLGVTNTVIRVYSGIFIAKDVTGPADGLVPGDRAFTGTVSCRYRDEPPVEATWAATQDAAWVSGNYLVGSVCRVTSEDPPGATGQPVDGDPSYIWGDPALGDPATVPPPNPDPEVEERPTITVENPTKRLFGRFYLTKAVTGATAGIVDPQPFPMTYTCQPGVGAPITGNVDIADGQRITVGPDATDDIRLELPVNSVCTLTEPGPDSPPMPPLKDSAWTWGEPRFDVQGDIPSAGAVTEACVTPPPGDPQVTPCLGFPARSVTVTIPGQQEDFPEPPNVGLLITNPVVKEDGAYTVSKSSDPPSGSVVAPGDTITYSVTVDSTGDVPVHDVVVTDDLSQVLPYATIGTISAPDGTSAAVTGSNLVWTVGPLPDEGQDDPPSSLTLTYRATVNPGATGVTIKNLVTATGDVPPESCDPCSTTHTTPGPPVLTKEPNGLPQFDTSTRNWTVPYRLTVTNPNPDATVPYTLTDAIAFPTDVTVVSGSVTGSPDGVPLFDPPWNGSDQTTIAADVLLPGGATHTYDIAVVATVPLTLDGSFLSCAASGSGGGSGFFNVATISSSGTESSDDACDPIPVGLVAVKQWTINGVSYANGSQPSGYSASLTLDGVDRTWGTIYLGYQPGAVVTMGERLTLPAGCTGSSTGTGPTTLNRPVTAVRVVNVVACATPPAPTPNPTPNPTPTPNPYPPAPLPNTGFAVEPWLAWGVGLLLMGGLLVYLGGRRRRGLPG